MDDVVALMKENELSEFSADKIKVIKNKLPPEVTITPELRSTPRAISSHLPTRTPAFGAAATVEACRSSALGKDRKYSYSHVRVERAQITVGLPDGSETYHHKFQVLALVFVVQSL
jgi:hypothetical protein